MTASDRKAKYPYFEEDTSPYWSVKWDFTLAPRKSKEGSTDWINRVVAN
jgi:hypothetical protein